jgi:hypothetical protein
MPEGPTDLELVDCPGNGAWLVNRSGRGIRPLVLWAGCARHGDLRQGAGGIPPLSRVALRTAFTEPGPEMAAVEEVIWEDGHTERMFKLPRASVSSEAEIGLPEASVEVRPLDHDQAVWQGLLGMHGWA